MRATAEREGGDAALGAELVDGFSFTNFPVASSLLAHFLKGKGAEIDYLAGSPISKKALASSGFQAVNEQVEGEIARQLKAGNNKAQLQGHFKMTPRSHRHSMQS